MRRLKIVEHISLDGVIQVSDEDGSVNTEHRNLAGMKDVPRAIEGVWKIESTRLVAAISRGTDDSASQKMSALAGRWPRRI